MRYAVLVSVIVAIISGCQSAPSRKTDSPAIVKTRGASEISVQAARPAVEAAYSQFVDVRTPEEYAAGHARRARSIPLDTLSENLDRLEKNEPVYLICRTDNRSRQAAKVLVDAGFSQAIVVVGGTEAWKAAGFPIDDGPSTQNAR